MIQKIQNFIGLASADEVREKFDDDLAQIILDERRIVFWRLGLPFGAMFGALVLILLMLFSQIMGYLYG